MKINRIIQVLSKIMTLMLLTKQRKQEKMMVMKKKLVKEKKETIIKMVIKIKINFKVIKNLNKMMKMIGIKLKKRTENVSPEFKKIKTVMKNKNSKITGAGEEVVSIEEDKEVVEIEEREVEIKKATQFNDPTKIDLMQ